MSIDMDLSYVRSIAMLILWAIKSISLTYSPAAWSISLQTTSTRGGERRHSWYICIIIESRSAIRRCEGNRIGTKYAIHSFSGV